MWPSPKGSHYVSISCMVEAVGIEPATLSLPVQCLCHSTSRKLVDGLVQTPKTPEKTDRPIDSSTVQLPSKTCRFLAEFRELSRVRSTESSGFMERAMGIEPMSETWESFLNCFANLPRKVHQSADNHAKRTGRRSVYFPPRINTAESVSTTADCRYRRRRRAR
jgi:hypothetical protein